MDGVLADFEAELFEKYPHLHDFEPHSKERDDEIDDICHNRYKDIFLNLPPYKDAIWAYNILDSVYHIYILSTPMWKLPESYTHKRIWVEKHLGLQAEKKLILSHNKGLVMGDYIIDDRIKHGVENFVGEHIHFGKGGHKGWREIVEYLSIKDNFKY